MSATGTGRLAGRVALVTGGGRGLGRGVARVLAGLGASVVVSDRFVDEAGTAAAATVAAEIEAEGGRAAADSGDIASFEGARAVVQGAVDAFGRLDILVTCAGTYAPSTILDVEQPEWEGLTAVHLVGHTGCLAAAAEVMRAQGDGGRIVTVSSRGGLFGPQTAYSGAKAAIMGLTTAAARELEPDGITVNCLLPSALTQLFPMDASRRRFGGMPLSLFMEADDIAPVVAYLCLDEASGVTGRFVYASGADLAVYEPPLRVEGHTTFVRRTRPWTVDEVADYLPSLLRADG